MRDLCILPPLAFGKFFIGLTRVRETDTTRMDHFHVIIQIGIRFKSMGGHQLCDIEAETQQEKDKLWQQSLSKGGDVYG